VQWLAPEGEGGGVYSVFRVFRMLRATRIMRVARLRIFQDLAILVKGLLGGMRVLAWSLVLIFLPLYCMAVMFRETIGQEVGNSGSGEQHFRTLWESLFTIFRCTVAGDCDTADGKPIFVLMAAEYGWGYGALYVMVVVFVSLGLSNVIAAVFVEQVIVGAKTSAMLMRRHRLRDKSFFARKIAELLKLTVELHDRLGPTQLSAHDVFQRAQEIQITPVVFDRFREDPRFCEILRELDVPDDEHLNLLETLDVTGNNSIEVGELVDGINRLRGEAKRSDIVHLFYTLRVVHAKVAELECRMQEWRRDSTGGEEHTRASEERQGWSAVAAFEAPHRSGRRPSGGASETVETFGI